MNTVMDYFEQAELAMAAYANLAIGTINATDLANSDADMTLFQAQHFSENWLVVAPTFTDPSGASATIFQNKLTGQVTLAIRGTELSGNDLLTDGLLALGVSSKLNPQFAALKAKLDNEWLVAGGPLHDHAFTVSGHSLGGYLAEAVKEQYGTRVIGAYLFNAPGSGGIVGTIAGLVSGLFNQPSPGANGTWNIKASEGASIIAGLGSQTSAGIPVQIEAAPGAGFGNHSIARLTDALAVQALYSQLGPNLAQDQLNALVDASGDTMSQTLRWRKGVRDELLFESKSTL